MLLSEDQEFIMSMFQTMASPRCDYCGISRALIYCKSDLAKLCLNCDGCVHSANLLSRRHPRSLICEKCFSQSAVIRCLDEKVSFCQGCHWISNCSGLGHRLHSLNPYYGCPSPIEFTKIWSSILEPSSSIIGSGYGSLSSCSNNGLFGMVKMDGLDSWIGSSSSSSMVPQNIHYNESNVIIKEDEEEDICEGLNMDDAPLNFDAGEDIKPCSKYNQYEDTGSDCFLIDKNSSVVTESDCLEVYGQTNNLIQTMNGNGNGHGNGNGNGDGNGKSMMMSSTCNRNMNMALHPPASTVGQIHGSVSISLSNITGESSGADYQDCGLSPGLLIGDSPWESNLEVSCPEARDRAKLRYKQKKSKRTFGKQIRYASRKARADTRKRVKGRFVKTGDAYDYDPLDEELLNSSNQETETTT